MLFRAGRQREPMARRAGQVAIALTQCLRRCHSRRRRPCTHALFFWYVAQLAAAPEWIEEAERVEVGRLWMLPADMCTQQMY